MSHECPLVTALLDLPNEDAQRSFLEHHREELTSETVAELGRQAERLRLESPAQALRAAAAMLQAADLLTDGHARADALRIKGNLLLYLGRCQESLIAYREARDIRIRRGEQLEIARLQVGWTWALLDLARYDEALELGLATGEILIKHQKWDWLANLELNISNIYRLTDRHAEALAACERSREYFLRVGNPVGAAQAQVNAARTMVHQDQFREALTLLHRVRSVFETHEAWVPLARTDLNLATLSFWLGHYREAWERYDAAWEAFKRLGNEMEMATVDLYRSRVHLSLNLFPEALQLAREARSVFERLAMARYIALADLSQAMAHRGLGNGEEALRRFENARAFFAAHQGETLVALIDLERAALLRRAGRSAEALSVTEEAVAVFSRHGMIIRRAQAQLLLAECHSDLDQVGRAASLYQKVADLPHQRRLPTLTFRARYGLGRIEETQGQQQAAYDHYQAAIEEIEAVRHGLRVDEFKASFLDDKLALYQAAVRLSLKMNRLEDAFSYVERAKSSALLDLLAHSLELRAEGGETVDPQALERLKALKEEWLWHHGKLAGPPIEESDDAFRGAEASDRSWDKLKRVEDQISRVLRQLQGHRVHSLIEGQERAWQELGRYLEPDTLLIEYFCIEDEILAFLVNADGLDVCRSFPYSLREVRRSLKALNLAFRGIDNLDPVYVRQVLSPLAQRHLSWLYEALVTSLSATINGYRKLIIVPHDALFYLPFHACHDGERYLIERFDVHYAPSAGVLVRCYQAREALRADEEVRPALVMGYSDGGRLRHVSDEVQAVAATLAAGSVSPLLFQEDEATLSRLLHHADGCRLIHLASHAVFRSDNPLFSSIRLADEPLSVMDIYRLRLHASLITLSGCETGMNRITGGDLFGLARGCLYAGVPALVASLWQVDDASTTLLMETFYRQLETGMSMASALRAAQLTLLRIEREHEGESVFPYAPPHYWAPFFLMGADGALGHEQHD